MKYFYYYLIIINLLSFFMMYYDKRQAVKHGFRVPEARIFLMAFILGGPGVLLGMHYFRHKTKHIKFVYGIPLIIIGELIIGVMIFKHLL